METVKRKCSAILAIPVLVVLAAASCEGFGTQSLAAIRAQQQPSARDVADVWLIVNQSRRALEIPTERNIKLNGAGKLEFEQGGRRIKLPPGLAVLVNGEPVVGERLVREGETVRIVNEDGETSWELCPAPIRTH